MNLLNDFERHVEHVIARTQGEIFNYAADKNYNMGIFADKYMKSDFCKNYMDVPYSPFQFDTDTACMEVIEKEFETKNIIIPKVIRQRDKYCAFNAGFYYRYLAFISGKSSAELIDKIPFEKMRAEYSLDHYEYPDAIRLICKYENIDIDKQSAIRQEERRM